MQDHDPSDISPKIFYKSTKKNESYHPDNDWRCGLINKQVKNLGKIQILEFSKTRDLYLYPAEDSFHTKLEGSN